MSDGEDYDDYKVGYGRAPREKRWSKGQSGNPRGRPKKSQDISDALHRALKTIVTVKEGENSLEMTALEAIICRLMHDATAGKPEALEILLQLRQKFPYIDAPRPMNIRIRWVDPVPEPIDSELDESILDGSPGEDL